jgi:chromosome segregation ATPase
MEELVLKLREIQIGLKRSLSDLQQKLEAFDSEPELLTNLENAKRDAEAKASSLEDEVRKLREELKDIRGFLGFNDDKK